MSRPTRRAILVIGPGAPDPSLPAGMTVIDRRATRIWPTPSGSGIDVVELLIAGDALPAVPECAEPSRLTLDEIRALAAEHPRAAS